MGVVATATAAAATVMVAAAAAAVAMAQSRVVRHGKGSNHNREGRRVEVESKDVHRVRSGLQKCPHNQYRPSPAHMIDRHQHRMDFH